MRSWLWLPLAWWLWILYDMSSYSAAVCLWVSSARVSISTGSISFFGKSCMARWGTQALMVKLRKSLFCGPCGSSRSGSFFSWSCDCCFLVPKSQVWRVGSKTFPIVGAESQFWPHDLSGNMSGLHQPYRNGSSTTAPFPFCSAGGYHSLWIY